MNGPNKLVFVPVKPFQPSVMWSSSLLGPFLSYEEKEEAVCVLFTREPYSQHFFVTCEFSTLEAAVCMLCTYATVKENGLT